MLNIDKKKKSLQILLLFENYLAEYFEEFRETVDE